MSNTRELGDKLEHEIYFKLNAEYIRLKLQHEINQTKGSGSSHHDGDLKDSTNFYVMECKVRNQKNLNISKEWIDNVKKQGELSNRDWIIINQLKDKSTYVTMDFETFKDLFALKINNSTKSNL